MSANGDELELGSKFSVLYQQLLDANGFPVMAARTLLRTEGAPTEPPPTDPSHDDIPTVEVAGVTVDDESAASNGALEHVASKDNMLNGETCVDEFTVQPPANALLVASSKRGEVRARYVPGRAAPWCLSFEDDALAVTEGDSFIVEVWAASSAVKTCDPVEGKK